MSHRPAFHNHPAAPGNSRVHVSEEPGPCGAHKRRGLSPACFLRSQRLQVSGKVGRMGLSQAGESRGQGLGAACGPGLAMAGVGTGSCWLTPCVLETTRCTTRGRSLPPRPSAGRSQPARHAVTLLELVCFSISRGTPSEGCVLSRQAAGDTRGRVRASRCDQASDSDPRGLCPAQERKRKRTVLGRAARRRGHRPSFGEPGRLPVAPSHGSS